MPRTKKPVPSPADEKVYDGSFTYTDLDGNEVEVKFTTSVSPATMGAYANNVINTIVNEEFGYLPYLYKIILYQNIIEMYTDFDTSISYEKFSDILYKTNLIENFEHNAADVQYYDFKDSVDKMIEFKKSQLNTKSEIDNIIISILDKVNSFVDSVVEIGPETLESAMGNLAKMVNVDEGNIIQALVKQSGVGKGKGGRPKGSTKAKDKNKVVPFPEPELDGQIDMNGKIHESEDE